MLVRVLGMLPREEPDLDLCDFSDHRLAQPFRHVVGVGHTDQTKELFQIDYLVN